jgi:dienelactone hydrolase
MASNPPGKCCYQGVRHEGTPTGKLSQLGDFEIYTVGEPSEHGIIVITDVLGHKFNNAQLIADQYAANGYYVVMPDLFDGNPIGLNRPEGFDIMKWLGGEYHPKKRAHDPPHVDPIIDSCIIHMRDQGVKKLGAVGYCFGAKYVVRHLRPDQGKIDAGYSAHPSFVQDDELNDIKGPFSIAAAETDEIFPTEKRHHTEELLKALGLPYQINLYAGVEHGFAVRGDPNDKKKQYAKEAAFLQAVQWFDYHLKGEALDSK